MRQKPVLSPRLNESEKLEDKKSFRYAFILPIAAALAVFWQVTHFDFVNHDDYFYVYNNPSIQRGVTAESLRWAFCVDLCFNSMNADYWQPVTMISRMIDVDIWGMNPRGHHLTNLLFHLANVLIFYFIFLKLSKRNYEFAAWLATAFAIHPAQADVIPWITARKDVLSLFFGLGAVWTYLKYVEKPRWWRYACILVLQALSLMSKPFLFTMPALLLLLDFWPLERWKGEKRRKILELFLEKGGFFLLSAISVWITLFTQSKEVSEAVFSHNEIAMTVLKYVRDFFYPIHFSVQEIVPDKRTGLEIFSAWSIIFLVTFLFLRNLFKRPVLAWGWLWFLVSLSPVIAIPHMPRYLPVPSLGLLIITGWIFLQMEERWKILKQNQNIIFGALFCVWAAISFFQAQHWRNSLSLGNYSVRINPDSERAHTILAAALLAEKNYAAAAEHFVQASKLSPRSPEIHTGLAVAFAGMGMTAEAIKEFELAIKLNPSLAETYKEYGAFWGELGECSKAIPLYYQALKLNPDLLSARLNLGRCFHQTGKKEEAFFQFKEAIRINPHDEKLYNNLAAALLMEKRWDEALTYLGKVCTMNPRSEEARMNFAAAQAMIENSAKDVHETEKK